MAPTNLTQPAFSSGIISSELFSRIDFDKIQTGLKQCENFVVRPAGGAIFRVGTKFINYTKNRESDVALIPFIFNRKDGLCLAFGEQYIEVYDNGVKIHEIVSPYHASEVYQIKYAQNKNEMYLVHPNHPPAVLKRNSNTNFSYNLLEFNPTVPTTTITIAAGDYVPNKDDSMYTKLSWKGWKYAVSVVDKDDNESLPTYSGTIENDIDLTHQPIKITVAKVADESNVDHYNIYRIKGGEYYLVYSAEKTGEDISIQDVGWNPNTDKSVKKRFDEFKDGNYPSAVAMWNQRLILGNTKSKPNTFWGSRVKQYEDFTNTIVNAADEGFELTFNSGTLDAITDFVPLDDLIVFTEGKIWRVQGTSVQNMSAFIESYSGASGLKPFVSKKSVLYVDSSLNTISNFVYSYELNGYTGQNLDILARDLMDGYFIRDISFRDTPYGVLYAVRNDGTLLGLTYMREENIYAWHKHTTQGGKFRSICSIDKDGADHVYCIVERNGVGHVEMFGGYITQEQGVDDSWHLDCASKYKSDWLEWLYTENLIKETNYYNYTYAGSITSSSFPAEWGAVIDYTKTCTMAVHWEAATPYHVCSIRFEKGFLPIYISHKDKSKNLIIDYSLFEPNDGYVYDSMSFSRQLKKFKNAKVVQYSSTEILWNINYGDLYGANELLPAFAAADIGWPFYNNTFSIYSHLMTTEEKDGVVNIYYEGQLKGSFFIGSLLPSQESVYIQNTVSGGEVFYNKNDKYEHFGIITAIEGDRITVDEKYIFQRNKSGDNIVTETISKDYYKYTDSLPSEGGVAYDDKFGDNPEAYSEYTENSITISDRVYKLNSGDVSTINSIDDLQRFAGKKVVAVIDTSIYRDLLVDENGHLELPVYGKSVLVGLPYNGILETIPMDMVVSGGSTTVGSQRRVFDGTLSYYRSRGLWYGRDVNHMYEIKPYTNENYSLNIPLESGQINLKVADGYSLESSLVVMQKSPLPALIQSITLGVGYNGKI
jgi:hypothetical protein